MSGGRDLYNISALSVCMFSRSANSPFNCEDGY
uniref:Uncharacterized protein n=1 Tax=Anguilla anguilla TaxID=7936 RepID=A0A0E9VXQ8_ANGAN